MGRITIDSEIIQFSAKIEVNPSLWDAKSGRATGKSKETTSINRKLDKLDAQIREHCQTYLIALIKIAQSNQYIPDC